LRPEKLPSSNNHTFTLRPGSQKSLMPVIIFEISVSDESFDPGEEVNSTDILFGKLE